MNRLEGWIYDKVEAYPKLRIPIVAAYQRICAIIPRMSSTTGDELQVYPGFFFGFHFNTPWDQAGERILAHRFRIDIPVEVAERLPLEIGIINEKNNLAFNSITETSAWNWQQGSMLQWVGKTGQFIFNDVSSKSCISRLFATDGTELYQYPMPVGNVSPDGKYALSFSFSRLGKCAPEYGYRGIPCLPNEGERFAGDGLWLLPLAGGNPEKLYDLRDLTNASPSKSMEGSKQFFTHCLFSPSGQKFAFFHRWINSKGMLFTRFHVSDLTKMKLQVLPVRTASHFAWQNDESLLAYCVPSKEGRRGYYLFNLVSGDYRPVGKTFFTSDGHPQFLEDSHYFVTDTYPDKYRIQRLYLFDVHNEKGIELMRLKIPFQFRYERRCDFHPRWSPDGKKICFDSAHPGVRCLCILSVGKYNIS
jgi:hypothetical protein